MDHSEHLHRCGRLFSPLSSRNPLPTCPLGKCSLTFQQPCPVHLSDLGRFRLFFHCVFATTLHSSDKTSRTHVCLPPYTANLLECELCLIHLFSLSTWLNVEMGKPRLRHSVSGMVELKTKTFHGRARARLACAGPKPSALTLPRRPPCLGCWLWSLKTLLTQINENHFQVKRINQGR